MKKTLRNLTLVLACVFGIVLTVQADNEKPISLSQLPKAAQQTVSKHFSGLNVALAKVESGLLEKSYDVVFTNGDHLEFDRNGGWTEISSKANGVPSALIPTSISTYLKSNYPGQKVVQIERDRKEYEIKLINGVEITFNMNFQVVDIDF